MQDSFDSICLEMLSDIADRQPQMSTVKKYLGQRSTLEIKREILSDFAQALRLELEVELKTSEHNELFTKPNFYLRLDSGKIIRCDIFALTQCFKLKEKKKIDKALIKTFLKYGSTENKPIQVEQNENSFMFYLIDWKDAK